nr:helix-turn-helix transcriptional regulator [Arsukibacterium perlucidum]
MKDRILSRRISLKLTQEAVAKIVGVNRVSVSNWETESKSGGMPSGKHLINLAKALKVTPEWILTGEEKPDDNNKVSATAAAYTVGSFDLWDSKRPLEEDEVEMPFYKEIELSAGTGSVVQRLDSGFKLRFTKSTLRRYNIQPELAACVTVSGNSMEPVLPDQATVGIDTGNTKIKDGDLYAIDHDGLLKLKRLYRLPGNSIRLRSFNTDEYPYEDYQTDQASAIKVLGRVFWYSVLR